MRSASSICHLLSFGCHETLKRYFTDLLKVDIEQFFRLHFGFRETNITRQNAALAVGSVSAESAFLTVLRLWVGGCGANLLRKFKEQIPIPFVLGRCVHKPSGFVWKICKPVDHLDLFWFKGQTVVQVRARLNQHRTIDARL